MPNREVAGAESNGAPSVGRGCPRSAGAAGQSTVELALVLPVLAIGLLAVIQVARVAGDQVASHHAVREAARAAALDPDPVALTARAIEAAPQLEPDRLQVELGPERARGQLVEVVVRYRSPTEVPIVGRFVDDVDIRASAVVRLE